ncbi:hypothetical protein ACLOJK_020415 [Asimina triloba]
MQSNSKKVRHLLDLQGLGDLKLFKADLSEDGSFEEAISGCDFVFHVATPVDFQSQDPEVFGLGLSGLFFHSRRTPGLIHDQNDMIKPSINGVLNILKSCAKVKTVKRVVYTSSIAAVQRNELTGTDLVLDEDNWCDVEYITSKKPFGWGYAVSKTLAEKMAFEFAKENNLDVISITPVVIVGESITQEVPHSVIVALSLLTGKNSQLNPSTAIPFAPPSHSSKLYAQSLMDDCMHAGDAGKDIDWLKSLQLLSGVLSVVHVIDVCRAHIFAAENESCSGRYICSAFDTTVPELAKFLAQRYPQYDVPTSFDDLPAKPTVRMSSEKLIKAGFTYNYGIEEIYDDGVKYFKAVGLLAK